MGLVKKFFAPLTNFLRIYRGLTRGTTEELSRSKHIREANEALQRRHEVLEEEIGKTQANLIDQVSSRLSQAQTLKKEMQSHGDALSGLIRDMGDPEADKERVFWELQKMGVSFDENQKSIPKSDELLKQFQEIGKIDTVLDFRSLVDQVREVGKESAILQHELQIFEESLSSNPNMKSAEAIEEAESLALQRGANPDAVKEYTDRIKSEWFKKKKL